MSEKINIFIPMKEQVVAIGSAIYLKGAKALLICATYLSPVNFVFFLVGFAIMLDTVAGRWCAKRLAKREGKDVRLEVTSKKTREGLIGKIISYNIAIITLFIIDNHVLNPLIQYYFEDFPINHIVTKLIGIIMVLIEMDSVDEKYYYVTGRRLKDALRQMIARVKKVILDLFNFGKSLKKDQ